MSVISDLFSPPGSREEILPATWRDLTSLIELEKACFKEDAWPLLDLLGVLTLPNVIRLKAVIDQRMVGFIAGDKRRARNIGWIVTFGVLPGYQRQGIGSRLLSACEQEMDPPRVRLCVRLSNTPAIELYKKFGYREIGVWTNYYIGKEDALVLEKHLSGR